jgi:hypothetical protein
MMATATATATATAIIVITVEKVVTYIQIAAFPLQV